MIANVREDKGELLMDRSELRNASDREIVDALSHADPILLPETGLAANSTYSDLLGRAFRVGFRLKL